MFQRWRFLNFHHLLQLNQFVMLYGTLNMPYAKKNGDEIIPPTVLELRINDVKLLDSLLANTSKTVHIKLNVTRMDKEGMTELIKVIKENPGKQGYRIQLFDPVEKKSCNMSPVKGSINAQEVLPLLEKMPFVEFDLR